MTLIVDTYNDIGLTDSATSKTIITSFNGVEFTVFPYCPLTDITESLEWLTDIMPSKDGSEQRMSVRKIPRQSFKYDIFLTTEKEQARFEALMFGWQKKTFGLPIWIEKVLHTTTITVADMSITVDTTSADFRANSLAIIWSFNTSYEVVAISTVADSSLTLSSPVQTTFTGAKFIMPLRIAQVTSAISGTNPGTASVRRVSINFAIKDNDLITGYIAPTTYDSLTVLDEVHKFIGNDKELTSDSDSQVQDYESGDFDYFSDSDFNIFTHTFGFIKETKATIWTFRKFLHSLYGMQGAVYIPTYREDLVQTEIIHAADTSFIIENVDLARNMGLNALRTNLVFIFSNGTEIYRKIMGITELDSDIELITLDSALGLDVADGDCYISFLDKCRLASDMVTINWIMPYKMKCNLSFLAIVDAPFSKNRNIILYDNISLIDGVIQS